MEGFRVSFIVWLLRLLPTSHPAWYNVGLQAFSARPNIVKIQ